LQADFCLQPDHRGTWEEDEPARLASMARTKQTSRQRAPEIRGARVIAHKSVPRQAAARKEGAALTSRARSPGVVAENEQCVAQLDGKTEDETFAAKLKLLSLYKLQTGHACPPYRHELGEWAFRLRKQHARKALASHQVEELKTLGFQFDGKAAQAVRDQHTSAANGDAWGSAEGKHGDEEKDVFGAFSGQSSAGMTAESKALAVGRKRHHPYDVHDADDSTPKKVAAWSTPSSSSFGLHMTSDAKLSNRCSAVSLPPEVRFACKYSSGYAETSLSPDVSIFL
jgi:hypothetical protein